ncbi:MAG: hypothetical protein WBO07_08570 [Formosimonas sp.]|jgi:riboflavin transporter FmnP
MRPVQFLLTAFAVLAVMLVVSYFIGGTPMMAKAAKWFIPLCFAAAAYNMSIGVRHAGYGIMEEIPFLLLNFGVPSIVAFFVMKKLAA